MSVSNETSPRYFHCDHNHGIFVSPNKVAKAGAEYKPRPEGEAAKRLPYKPVVNHGKVRTLGYLLQISTWLLPQTTPYEVVLDSSVLC